MTATQAPTPGPLSVGDRVVAVADLRKHPDGPVWVQKGEEVGIVREYGIDNCIAGVALQDGREGDWAKSCFRLAPTAPVEASGSERRRDGCQTDVERSAYAEGLSDAAQRARYLSKHQEWEEDDGGPNSRRDGFEFACEVLSDLLEEDSSGALKAALRPQPSGETREALDRLKMAAHVYEDDEMAADCATLEALLSARPLALGGQQGVGEVVGDNDLPSLIARAKAWSCDPYDKAIIDELVAALTIRNGGPQ